MPGTVGVAPGTIVMQLDAPSFAGPQMRRIQPLRGLGVIDTSAHVRWDLIAGVGGSALVIALLTGLIASAIGTRR